MHINSLPTDVLLAILTPYCEKKLYIDGHWRRPTNILSVCQRWRQLALPITFNKISISLNNGVWTNIDIMTHGMKQYPRTVEISMESMVTDLAEYLDVVVKKLKSIEGMLDNVVNLSLTLDAYGSFFNYEEEEYIAPEIDFTGIAKKLYALLPNILSLHNNNESEESAVFAFESALLKLYAPQLTQVTASPMAMDSDICFSKLLSTFAQSWAWDATVLPKINVDNLTKLELACVKESFNWSAFSNAKTDDSGLLHFPALEFLSISMSSLTTLTDGRNELSIPGNRFAYTLEVPSLVYLDICVLCPLSCSLIASISTHRTLNKFVMANNHKTKIEFYGFSMSDVTKSVFKKHYRSSTESKEADIIEVANDLQAVDGFKCSAIEAYVTQEITTLEMQCIDWPQVTRLSLYYSISMPGLLELIQSNLPKLRKLEAYHIKLSDMKDDKFVIPEIQDNSITSINSQIRKLVYSIGAYDEEVPDKVRIAFEESMAKILPSLKYWNMI